MRNDHVPSQDVHRFCRVRNAVSSAVHRSLAVDLNCILSGRNYHFDTLCPSSGGNQACRNLVWPAEGLKILHYLSSYRETDIHFLQNVLKRGPNSRRLMAVEGGLRWIVFLRGRYKVRPLQGNSGCGTVGHIPSGASAFKKRNDTLQYITQHVDEVGYRLRQKNTLHRRAGRNDSVCPEFVSYLLSSPMRHEAT